MAPVSVPVRGTGRTGGSAFLPLLAAVLAALLVAGCASSAAGGPGPPVISASASPGGSSGVVTVAGDHANGTTVHVRVGERVSLVLSSSYWQLRGSSAPKVLRQDGPVTALPRPSTCPAIPGLGCTPVRIAFTALTRGTAVITASRTTCGEALACAPDQRHFNVTIVVR